MYYSTFWKFVICLRQDIKMMGILYLCSYLHIAPHNFHKCILVKTSISMISMGCFDGTYLATAGSATSQILYHFKLGIYLCIIHLCDHTCTCTMIQNEWMVRFAHYFTASFRSILGVISPFSFWEFINEA